MLAVVVGTQVACATVLLNPRWVVGDYRGEFSETVGEGVLSPLIEAANPCGFYIDSGARRCHFLLVSLGKSLSMPQFLHL